ncbi:MAG: NTP transferase domain-containing protein [Treponema sp.]|nr:NTP transferase domain-containing protein [Treponema sp.]
MQALILAAGMGNRLGKYTRNNTKCMLSLNGKTLIERALDAVSGAGIRRCFIVALATRRKIWFRFWATSIKMLRLSIFSTIFITKQITSIHFILRRIILYGTTPCFWKAI